MDDRSFVAAQDFILEAKTYWTKEIYPCLKADYEAREEQIEITIPNDENINNGFYMIFGLDNNSTPTIGNSIIIK